MTETTSDTQEVAPVAIREAYGADHSFILATWLRSFRHGSPFARRLVDAVFYANHHPLVEAIVSRSTTLVATLEDDPNVILGYLVTEHQGSTPVLHFAYVKKEFRRMRVLTQLLEESTLPAELRGAEVSHPTFDWLEFLAPKFPLARCNPYRGLQAPGATNAAA